MRRRTMLAAVSGGGGDDSPVIPSEYQKVEYIKSSGTQFINTGVKYYKHTIYLDAQFLSYGSNMNLAGTGQSGQMAKKAYVIGFNTTYGIGCDANNHNPTSWHSGKTGDIHMARFQMLANDENGNLTFNGTEYTPTYSLDTNEMATYPLFLFARNYGGSINMPATAAIYRCKIWNKTTSELLRDFVPCYRKSDEAIGMYDVVTGTFFTNSGTGTFTKGPNV